ncbi:MAG: methyltransferase domain-containing protein [Gammaproteobacteria bacterium]|nr:methyltransferase domain-containing protein [Gammaproteobacteria bacterium]
MQAHLRLNSWYQSSLGQYLLEQLQAKLDSVLSTSFGYYAVTIGCESIAADLMDSCRIKHVFRLGHAETDHDAMVDSASLPIAADSTDMVVLVHALSQANDPHAILREVDRVLIPDGKLIIIDFNPVSLWGIRHLLQAWLDDAPWAGHYYTAGRLKDWTSLLGFEQTHHIKCGHVLPLNYQRLIARSRILTKFSERWLNFSGALNVMVFEKNTIPLTPVRSRWVKRQILPAAVARPTVGRGMKYDK